MTKELSAMEELYNQSIKILKEGQIIKVRIVSIKAKGTQLLEPLSIRYMQAFACI